MDAALESVFERLAKWEAESERKFLARRWKKVGFAQGKRVCMDEGKRIGPISERKSTVQKLRQKGHGSYARGNCRCVGSFGGRGRGFA